MHFAVEQPLQLSGHLQDREKSIYQYLYLS